MKRFFECTIPNRACNLKCSYCYVIQKDWRDKGKSDFLYSPKHVGKALSIERLGGVSYISMTASGESLMPKEITAITHEILKQGHFVNITTNGIISKRFDEILDFNKELLSHLNFSFSFHYLELIRVNKLEVFFDNIKKVKSAGCSFVLQINLCDEYMPYWEDIKKISVKETGALPQVALTRDESNGTYKILTQKTTEEYHKIGKEMNSPLFDFTCKNFIVKRKEFCYAGEWSAQLHLGTGEMTGCYGAGIHQNIFEDISKPIKFRPVGSNCPFTYCVNSSHFLSLGVIPDMPTPSYGGLRNRKEAGWYSDEMDRFLSERLYDNNTLYTKKQKRSINLAYRSAKITRYPISLFKRVLKKIK